MIDINNYEVGQKVWDTHNNRIYTLKSSEKKYGTTMWSVEENGFEWREDWFGDIPRYVQDLIDKAEATEKAYGELKQDVKQITLLLQSFRFNYINDMTDKQIDLLLDKFSKVGEK